MTNDPSKTNEIIFYSSPRGDVKVEVLFNEETFWLSQKRMAELFNVDVRTVNEHLKNIYNSSELEEGATIRKIRIVQKEGLLTQMFFMAQAAGASHRERRCTRSFAAI